MRVDAKKCEEYLKFKGENYGTLTEKLSGIFQKPDLKELNKADAEAIFEQNGYNI